ncbi:GTP-binding protein Rit2 isoform X1 [Athene noctua]|uniref:GTP-binding protein Rit2 isoform X1 n=1 Tax=Athene noctua TaxID=126797 RepID=UPI003EBEFC04
MELENEMISSSSNSSAGSREYKVVMLGAGGVGKSAMTMQFISHRFPDYHDPTIEDAYKTQVRIDDEPAYLDILDTAGQAEFTAMRDQYMRGGEGFIICYSITDRQSFQEAAEFKELIYRVRHTYDIPLVLVGNKIDLEEFRQDGGSTASLGNLCQGLTTFTVKNFFPLISLERSFSEPEAIPSCPITCYLVKETHPQLSAPSYQVSTEEGMSLAREYSCSFFETSAALRFYIDDVFHGLVREIRRKESSLPMVEKKMKRKDSLWRKLKGSLKKKKENTT